MGSKRVFRAGLAACACMLVAAPAVGAQLPGSPSGPQVPRLPGKPVETTLRQVLEPVGQTLSDLTGQLPQAGTPQAPPSSPSAPSASPAQPRAQAPSTPPAAVGSPAGRSGSGPGDSAGPAKGTPVATAQPAAGARAERGSSRQAERRRADARRAERRQAAKPKPMPATTDEGSGSIPDTFAQIVEVVPDWARAMVLALATVALGFGTLLLIARARERRLHRQREELIGDLGTLQEALLPDVPDAIGGLGVSVSYRPADGLAAGGDFYDVFELHGGRVGLIVGDVAGHGRDALKQTAVLHYTLRAYLEADMEPRAALQVTASTLERGGSERHATAVVAVYEPERGRLTYATAGHPPPILVGGDHTPVAAFSSPPLGLGLNAGIRQTTITVPSDTSVCFFTDGLEDVRVGERTLGRDGLLDVLAGLGPQASADAVVDAVVEQATRTEDDIAVCVLRQTRQVRATSACEEQLVLDAVDAGHPDAERFLIECGVPEVRATEAMKEARAMVERSRAVILWTMRSSRGAEVEVLPSGGPGLPPATHPPARLVSRPAA